MFKSYQSNQKVALAVLACVSLETEVDLDRPDSWSLRFLKLWCTDLEIDESYIEAYSPLISSSYSAINSNIDYRIESLLPFLPQLDVSFQGRVTIFMQFLLFLVMNKFYDARGRCLVRNLIRTLSLSSNELILIETELTKCLLNHQQEISHKLDKDRKNNPRSRAIRYAKIGAASLGAGAVLAVTGGLAAPAIAGALVLMGSSSAAAAAVSVGSMAFLFGTTGAGLTGYRMMRRTRGVEEFEFESYDNTGKLAVMIMVSGWMEEKEDYKRTFGVLPEEMPIKERLIRFYTKYDKNRLNHIDEEILQYFENEHVLFDELYRMYGHDPRAPEEYDPPAFTPPPGDETAPLEELLEAQLAKILATSGVKLVKEGERGAESFASSAWNMFSRKKREDPTEAKTQDVKTSKDTYSTVEKDNNPGEQTEAELKEYEEMSSFRSVTLTGEGDAGESLLDSEEKKKEIKEQQSISTFEYWHWRELSLSSCYDLMLLRWETGMQLELGSSIADLVKNLSTTAVQKVLETYVFAALAAAVAWPALLLSLTSVIDGLWTIAMERADEAGKELAHALLSRPVGSRPVTLVGFSVGARVVFSCLRELGLLLQKEQHKVDQTAPGNRSDKIPNEGVLDDDEVPLEMVQQVHERQEEKKQDEADLIQGAGSTGGASGSLQLQDELEGVFDPEAPLDPSVQPHQLSAGAEEVESGRGVSCLGGPTAMLTSMGNSVMSLGVTDRLKFKGATTDLELPEGWSLTDLKSVVQDAVMLGTPVSSMSRSWKDVRQVVAGRVINGYSSKDVVMSLIYRYQRVTSGDGQAFIAVSGITPVHTPGVENVDLSSHVQQHIHYCQRMKKILEILDLSNPYVAPV